MKKGVLRNFAKFTGNTYARASFLIKLQASETLLKKRLWYSCFTMNFARFLRASFLQNTSGRLLLQDYAGLTLDDLYDTACMTHNRLSNF